MKVKADGLPVLIVFLGKEISDPLKDAVVNAIPNQFRFLSANLMSSIRVVFAVISLFAPNIYADLFEKTMGIGLGGRVPYLTDYSHNGYHLQKMEPQNGYTISCRYMYFDRFDPDATWKIEFEPSLTIYLNRVDGEYPMAKWNTVESALRVGVINNVIGGMIFSVGVNVAVPYSELSGMPPEKRYAIDSTLSDSNGEYTDVSLGLYSGVGYMVDFGKFAVVPMVDIAANMPMVPMDAGFGPIGLFELTMRMQVWI